MIGCDSLGPLSSGRLLVRVDIFCSRARSQGLVLASPKRSLHLWHPREQKNSLAFQAPAGECALRPAQGTRAGGPRGSGGDRAAKARLPGAPSLAEGPGRVFWLGLDHGGSEPGWVPMQRANRSLSRVGRKGGSAPLNSQLLSMCCAPGCQVRIPERPQGMQGAAASAEGPATPVQDSPYHPPRPLASFGFNVMHFEVGIWSILKARHPGSH